MKSHFDLIVLGAGSGGLAAAKRAASYGARVAIVEGDRVGGTCVIRGCVPKKLLVYGSLYSKYLDNASGFGVNVKDAFIDSSVLLENVRNEVDRLNKLHIDLLSKAGVELFSGWGSFLDPNKVLIRSNDLEKSGRIIYGENILIAVGGKPDLPNIPGHNLIWSSDDMFLQNGFPEKVVIVGAGFIACEFACILNGLGVKVVQLVRGHRLLRKFDKELTIALQEDIQGKGIELIFGDAPKAIDGVIGNLKVKTNSNLVIDCGGVLFATGRKPFLENLNLNAAGVVLLNGKVEVDSENRTNIQNIFALGDVSNDINLTPVAIDEGRAFSDRVFGEVNRKVNYNFIPTAVFSQPEIAGVGLTEAQAVEKFGIENIKIFSSRFRPMSQALTKCGNPCILKLVVKLEDNIILGCHMLGENAAEIIQMASISMLMGATKKDFDLTMALHPTVSEEFVTMQ